MNFIPFYYKIGPDCNRCKWSNFTDIDTIEESPFNQFL